MTKQAAISKDMVKMAKSRISSKYLSETEVAVQAAIKALETGDKNLLKSSLQTVSDQLESLSPDIYVDKLKNSKKQSKDSMPLLSPLELEVATVVSPLPLTNQAEML